MQRRGQFTRMSVIGASNPGTRQPPISNDDTRRKRQYVSSNVECSLSDTDEGVRLCRMAALLAIYARVRLGSAGKNFCPSYKTSIKKNYHTFPPGKSPQPPILHLLPLTKQNPMLKVDLLQPSSSIYSASHNVHVYALVELYHEKMLS